MYILVAEKDQKLQVLDIILDKKNIFKPLHFLQNGEILGYSFHLVEIDGNMFKKFSVYKTTNRNKISLIENLMVKSCYTGCNATLADEYQYYSPIENIEWRKLVRTIPSKYVHESNYPLDFNIYDRIKLSKTDKKYMLIYFTNNNNGSHSTTANTVKECEEYLKYHKQSFTFEYRVLINLDTKTIERKAL